MTRDPDRITASVIHVRDLVLEKIEEKAGRILLDTEACADLAACFRRLQQGPLLVQITEELLKLSYFLHVNSDYSGARFLFDLAKTSITLLERQGDGELVSGLREYEGVLGLTGSARPEQSRTPDGEPPTTVMELLMRRSSWTK